MRCLILILINFVALKLIVEYQVDHTLLFGGGSLDLTIAPTLSFLFSSRWMSSFAIMASFRSTGSLSIFELICFFFQK